MQPGQPSPHCLASRNGATPGATDSCCATRRLRYLGAIHWLTATAAAALAAAAATALAAAAQVQRVEIHPQIGSQSVELSSLSSRPPTSTTNLYYLGSTTLNGDDDSPFIFMPAHEWLDSCSDVRRGRGGASGRQGVAIHSQVGRSSVAKASQRIAACDFDSAILNGDDCPFIFIPRTGGLTASQK